MLYGNTFQPAHYAQLSFMVQLNLILRIYVLIVLPKCLKQTD